MLDRLGKEVKVGDTVAFALNTRGVPDMQVGKITDIGFYKRAYHRNDGVKIKPLDLGDRYDAKREAVRYPQEFVKIK